ncbi:Diacylglycerol O-acyltransferase 1 [Dichanthelium oligosanthes]|uniref:O-acyltransferase n=1 Tax=Dichanthelium oligosanthes TaxID=888268 RepID=A0A1E5UL36_9POAL|nr:Diacylglycerol O-acyltransferase 1 [Dichanthelium oligosanthes]
MGDSDEAPPSVRRRPPRPARGGGGAVEGFAAALRRRLRSGASVAARASFAADSGDESATGDGEPSSSSRRRDTSEDASSAAGGGGRGGGGAGAGGGGGDFSAFTFRAAAPVHRKPKESPLSSDAIFKQSHAGLFNLCIVVLVAVNSRLIIENLMKAATSLHIFLTTAEIVYPVLVILKCDSAVLSGFLLMFIACIVCLKLVSFAHTNHDIRKLMTSGKQVDNELSTADTDNLQAPTLGSLVYFMMAPTLCYQPSYPRTTHIRKGWLIRQIILYLIFTGLQGFIIEQYINPIVVNSQHPLKGGLLNAVETVLKLSLPNVYLWLCMFYCFFHLWLNILAEILRFGDREFYKDWWNAKTIDEYWRKWNMPVHKWVVRHVYFPCIRNGISKEVAVFISFFVSAVLHEIPLIILTSYLKNKFRDTMVGNMIFWFFFCIYGQPMCVLLYYHDVMNRIDKTK